MSIIDGYELDALQDLAKAAVRWRKARLDADTAASESKEWNELFVAEAALADKVDYWILRHEKFNS